MLSVRRVGRDVGGIIRTEFDQERRVVPPEGSMEQRRAQASRPSLSGRNCSGRTSRSHGEPQG